MKIALTCFSTDDSDRRQLAGDAGVAPALGHLAQHVELARGEPGQRRLAQPARRATSASTTCGSTTDPPAGHLAQRRQQLAQVTDPVLEQVGQAVGAVAEQLEGVGLVGVLGQDDHADLRVGRPDGVGRVDALHRGPWRRWCRRAGRRHPDVGQHRVRAGQRPHRVEQFRR